MATLAQGACTGAAADVHTLSADRTINIRVNNTSTSTAGTVSISISATGTPTGSEPPIASIYLGPTGTALNNCSAEITGLAVSSGKHVVINGSISNIGFYIGGY